MADRSLSPSSSAPLVQKKHASKWSKCYSWLGFERGYNVPLFIIFAGAMLGFSLARFEYLDWRIFSKAASPGEPYWYSSGHRRVGLFLHLGTILPAGTLMIFQFIPAIRRRAILFHRINGHAIIVLVMVSNAGALMIARRAFGGDLATQGGVGVLVISTTVGLILAYFNIKKLQVDQHRNWMLRCMFYLGTIITTRLIMIISALVASKIGGYAVLMSCGELESMHGPGYLEKTYPDCVVNSTVLRHKLKPIMVDFSAGVDENTGAALRIGFGMSIWLAFFLHAVGVEIYLSLTPREAHRLRMVSYERQLEAQMSNPGSAGLVVERFGDAEPWQPARSSSGSQVHTTK